MNLAEKDELIGISKVIASEEEESGEEGAITETAKGDRSPDAST